MIYKSQVKLQNDNIGVFTMQVQIQAIAAIRRKNVI